MYQFFWVYKIRFDDDSRKSASASVVAVNESPNGLFTKLDEICDERDDQIGVLCQWSQEYGNMRVVSCCPKGWTPEDVNILMSAEKSDFGELLREAIQKMETLAILDSRWTTEGHEPKEN